MKEHEHAAIMLCMAMFAIGAVIIILYQHASATNTIIGALGASGNVGLGGSVGVSGNFGLGVPVSLAGTPTVGQDGSSQSPAVLPMNINPGYTMQ